MPSTTYFGPAIDAHTHIYPPAIVAEIDAFRRRDRWFDLLHQNPETPLASADDLIASMDRSGISRAIVCGFPWNDAGIAALQNDYLRESRNRFPDCLDWLAVVRPGSRQAASDVIDRFAQGASGVGELNADAQGFLDRMSDALAPIAEVCVAACRPLMIHASEPVGHDYPGKGCTTPDRVLALAVAFPELDICAAHWGGGLPFYELMPEVRQQASRIVYDTAATTYLYDDAVFATVMGIVGTERVLFGSDFPVLGQLRLANRLRELPWASAQEAQQVMSANAIRFYRLRVGE